ncbi:sulfurtransferase [Demetria terragena]|uniref:sulfurtransferase n=1 Tax=Demetria terragena TaxID=63959 RepID=UPI000376D5FD|nr:sulfurtransferase [Demetria terragena]
MRRPDGPLISAEHLQRARNSAAPPVLLDVSWSLGSESQRAAYDREHLPGAAWVEFEGALSGLPGEQGRHPMPEVAAFTAALRAAGVRNDSHVVVYDRENSLSAARLWWLLKHAGHEAVQVLDGGMRRWLALGLPTNHDPVIPTPGDFVATPPHRQVLSAEDAADYADRHVLLDARPAPRFHGRQETIDPIAGHIPGAVSAPALNNLQEDGRFLPADDLAVHLTRVGVRPGAPVGVYCGSGVQAMHTALAIEAAQVGAEPAVYVGSWSHWITDPERPIAT